MPEEVHRPKQPENWQIRDIEHPKGYTVTASNFMQQAVKGLGITSVKIIYPCQEEKEAETIIFI